MQMPATDRERMCALYEERFAEHGVSPESLGWTKGRQDIRFNALLDSLEEGGDSFLDIGCGFGDLNDALVARGRPYRYLGVDVVENFVEEGKARRGSDTVQFQAGDFMATEFEGSFDCVIASGVFTFQLEDADQYAYIQTALERMLELCKVGVAVDFLSDRVNYQQDHCFHAQPERILELALGLTRRVRLRHDYLPFEFAVALFKDDIYDEERAVFNPLTK